MILPTTILFGTLIYLFYSSKKELSLDHHDPIENQKDNPAVIASDLNREEDVSILNRIDECNQTRLS